MSRRKRPTGRIRGSSGAGVITPPVGDFLLDDLNSGGGGVNDQIEDDLNSGGGGVNDPITLP